MSILAKNIVETLLENSELRALLAKLIHRELKDLELPQVDTLLGATEDEEEPDEKPPARFLKPNTSSKTKQEKTPKAKSEKIVEAASSEVKKDLRVDFRSRDDVVVVTDYSQKTHALFGDFGGKYKEFKDEVLLDRANGTKFNKNLAFGAGWILMKKENLSKITKALKKAKIPFEEHSREEYENLLRAGDEEKEEKEASETNEVSDGVYVILSADCQNSKGKTKNLQAHLKFASQEDLDRYEGTGFDCNIEHFNEWLQSNGKEDWSVDDEIEMVSIVDKKKSINPVEVKEPSKKTTKTEKKVKTEKAAKSSKKEEPVKKTEEAAKTTEKKPIRAKKNACGNLEDNETGFVFCKLPIGKNKKLLPVTVGWQNPTVKDGEKGLATVLPLDEDAIEECKTNGWRVLTQDMIAIVNKSDAKLAKNLTEILTRELAESDDESDLEDESEDDTDESEDDE